MIEASAPGRYRYLTLCAVLLAFSYLSACGRGTAASTTGGDSSTGGSQTTPTAPTVTLNTSATSIVAGGSLTLTVVASNATQFVISDNCDSQTTTVQATGAAQPVPITVPTTPATCTYTATASGTARNGCCQCSDYRAIFDDNDRRHDDQHADHRLRGASDFQCHRNERQFGVHHE